MRTIVYLLISTTIFLTLNTPQVSAATTKIRGKVSESGLTVLAIAEDGSSVTSELQKFLLSSKSAKVRLFLIDSSTSPRGPIVLGIKKGTKLYTVTQARKKKLCTNARAITQFAPKKLKGVFNLGTVTVEDNMGHPKSLKPDVLKTLAKGATSAVDANCVPVGAESLGIGATSSPIRTQASRTLGATGADSDTDGMPNAFDVDDDNDGVLDNDDSDSSGGGATQNSDSFWVFSNFHQDMEDSLNANAMTLTTALIDKAVRKRAGLAIQVVRGGSVPGVELDCGTLPYCSAGGFGRAAEPFPDGAEFPEGVDSDNDGLGTITAGNTGDFQLQCFKDAVEGYAASSAIKAGDVYIQRYSGANGETVEVPGMLNFIFHTTPAVKTVQTGVKTYTVSYPVVTGDPGTNMNCFHVPTTGDAIVTLTVWRPQRKGITEAGEAELMDMGNLRLVTNMPNGPCTGLGFACEQGPGLASPSVYSESDPNLTIVADGLQDTLGDSPASPENTFTYSINLSQAVAAVSGVTWDAGEKLSLPVQMMNIYGDNTVQNICFVRDDSVG